MFLEGWVADIIVVVITRDRFEGMVHVLGVVILEWLGFRWRSTACRDRSNIDTGRFHEAKKVLKHFIVKVLFVFHLES